VDYDLNIPGMLLMIGYLTTPSSSAGVSLSEFWAWVRYLAAVTAEPDLRLSQSFANLDAHQKTILSDDFGMGAPMVWLSERLGFDEICDGHYFMDRVAASVGATARKKAKRGPNKTPDFVARDSSGVWHVIECKGTQSGSDYSRRQLGQPGPPATGGVAQKCSIVFPSAYTGQRLATGLVIGVQGGSYGSRLTVVDPEPEEPFEIATGQLDYAEDAATRSVLAKALRLSGFDFAAEATASPLGPLPGSTRSVFRRTEERRQGFVDERDLRAREELAAFEMRRPVFEGEGRFRGREFSFDLPRPVYVNGQPMMRAVVRQGLSLNLLTELQKEPTISQTVAQRNPEWRGAFGRTSIEGDERSASMRIGKIFKSEINLE
jgi:hypothetical protein